MAALPFFIFTITSWFIWKKDNKKTIITFIIGLLVTIGLSISHFVDVLNLNY